ncbi:hypothetical protein GTY54_07690 [Streptomyces sp. SID625]|nr:hypothetical protein [Streptomyces sp. SID625]
MTTGRRRPGRTAEDTRPVPRRRSTAAARPSSANWPPTARVLGWSEGVHLRTEYLAARDAVVRHLVERHPVRAIAAETDFALSRPARHVHPRPGP